MQSLIQLVSQLRRRGHRFSLARFKVSSRQETEPQMHRGAPAANGGSAQLGTLLFGKLGQLAACLHQVEGSDVRPFPAFPPRTEALCAYWTQSGSLISQAAGS